MGQHLGDLVRADEVGAREQASSLGWSQGWEAAEAKHPQLSQFQPEVRIGAVTSGTVEPTGVGSNLGGCHGGLRRFHPHLQPVAWGS